MWKCKKCGSSHVRVIVEKKEEWTVKKDGTRNQEVGYSQTSYATCFECKSVKKRAELLADWIDENGI